MQKKRSRNLPKSSHPRLIQLCWLGWIIVLSLIDKISISTKYHGPICCHHVFLFCPNSTIFVSSTFHFPPNYFISAVLFHPSVTWTNKVEKDSNENYIKRILYNPHQYSIHVACNWKRGNNFLSDVKTTNSKLVCLFVCV